MLNLLRAAALNLLLVIPHATVFGHPEQRPSFDPAYYPKNSVITRDVAVIGGGSGGTYTAIRAKDSNKSVVVIEKKNRLGGHTETYTDPATGVSVNYGVVAWHDLPLVRNYLARLNVSLGKIDLNQFQPRSLDFATGKDAPGFPANLSDGIAAYIAQLSKYPDLEAGYFLPDPVPEELLLPLAEYVEKYPAVKPAVRYLFLSTQGLGDTLYKLPVLYVIKNWGLDVLRNVQNGFLTAGSGNLSELYRNAGAVLGRDVFLNSTVIATRRKAGANCVEIVVKTPSGPKLILAKKLVVAIPQLPENLRGFDLVEEELSLFSRFSSKGYYTGLVRDPGVPLTPFSNSAADTPYNVPRLPAFYSLAPTQIPGLVDFKYGSDTLLSDEEAKANIIRDFERLHEVGTFNKTFKPEIFIYSNHSPFELNVSPRDIANGFYRKLYALQGKRRTYYTGAVFHTHDSSLIWNYTEANVIPGITA